MAELQVSPYGSWKSPITSDLIASGMISLAEPRLDGKAIYWIETRPSEGGRNVVVKRDADGTVAAITPHPFNARTRVHEYGGGAYLVSGGSVYFSNFADQRIYHQAPSGAPEPLTPAGDLRFAELTLDARRDCLICVCEDHGGGGREPVNTLVEVRLRDGSVETLASGYDFYSSPRLSPDGRRLAWLTWNHPNMPWDGTELWVAGLDEHGSLVDKQLVAGGDDESILQPEWSPDGTLHFVSDRTGWWNLYRLREGRVDNVFDMPAEFGAPQWVFGLSTYAFISPDQVICAYNEKGAWRLVILDTSEKALQSVATPFTEIRYLRTDSRTAVFCGGSPGEPLSVIRLGLESGHLEVLRRSSNVEVDPRYFSAPRAVEFPTEGGKTAHAFFYPPANPDYAAPYGELPPLVVMSHGGPTASTSTTLNLAIQYWTSHGIAVLDVNYGGSTGYGRDYRQRLNGNWGVVDVDDCINGALYLANRGEVDRNRLVIRGGSAGGYTTLAALTFRNVFKAGASYFGISDLEALEQDTHKFESRYSSSLVGPYPERRDLYRQRSPIHFTEQLSCPMILFQGLEDKVVPPNQAEMMFEAVKNKGIPVAYVPFEGEQHGFRKAENIKRALDAELYFYSRVFGFELAQPVEPVRIENL